MVTKEETKSNSETEPATGGEAGKTMAGGVKKDETAEKKTETLKKEY